MRRAYERAATNGLWGVLLGVAISACSGSTGPTGPQGATGTMGAPGSSGSSGSGGGGASASVSSISPLFAFQGRTINVSISGTGTTWDAKTTVAFANTGVTVNSVTVASTSGLVANITVGSMATIGSTDVTVTDGTSVTVFKAAFQIESPLTVTVTPATGVPQGGLANLHVQMNDLTTPLDPDTFNVTVSSMDLETSQPEPSDYAFDLTIQADVLATPGTFDLTVTSGEPTTITSLAPQSFKIVARAPTVLTAGTAASGSLMTELDTELYSFTPAAASQQFVQFTTTSMAGLLVTSVIPKSGAYADALDQYNMRFAEGITSTDPFYLVVADSDGLFGPGPVPADTSIITFLSPCTAATEESETSTTNDDKYQTAQVVATLPTLVSGTLGYGTVDGTVDLDFYSISVPSGSKTIHAATGGDPLTDTAITIYDGTGTSLVSSDDSDLQEDLVYTLPTITTATTYYVAVSASMSGNFSDADNTYQLFVSVQ